MKFLFFFALSALLGAAYAIYAPDTPAKFSQPTPTVQRNTSDADSYRQELQIIEAQLNLVEVKRRELDKKINELRSSMRDQFTELADRNITVKHQAMRYFNKDKPEESALLFDAKFPNFIGLGGLEMRANSIRRLKNELDGVQASINSLSNRKTEITAKMEWEEKSKPWWKL